jgi:serine/threonine-protein kinase
MLDECVTSQRVANKPNIVNTFDVQKVNNGNTIIIVMEFIDGISLRDYINEKGILQVKEAVYIFEKMLNAIKVLHNFKEKIIHRDLKPENIMLTRDLMNVKLIDFGISTVRATDDKILTYEGTTLGTPPYISPDFYRMCQEKDKTTKSKYITEQFDFFALGVIFYEMLMGEKPFVNKSKNENDIIKVPYTYDPIPISNVRSDISPALDNIIFKCLATKSNDLQYRYNNVDEILKDLHSYIENPNKSFYQKLIKPKNKRTLQLADIFNVEKEKQRLRFYNQKWFY